MSSDKWADSEWENDEPHARDIGCWYCRKRIVSDGLFSTEFDCWLHEDCLVAALKRDPKDLEAAIMAREFADVLGGRR